MKINISKRAHERLNTLAHIRDQKIAEVLDDILARFDSSDLTLKPETVRRLNAGRPKSILSFKPENGKANEHP